MLVVLFAAATLTSALCMFSLEPMLAKMLLPILGGGPAVWNACLVFFQAALLAGYSLAHALARLGPKRHAIVHAILVVAAVAALPVGIRETLAPGAPPALRVMIVLAAGAGIPFLVLAMNGPVMAHLFGSIDDARTANPYFLYAASNAGSLIALVAYPFVIEPYFGLRAQAALFTAGWLGLILFVVASAVIVVRSRVRPVVAASTATVSWRRRLRWVLLAAVPSTYLVCVTQFLTTDIAAAPLLWVVPLAIYLLTFVLVFAKRLRPSHTAIVRVLPLFAAMTAITIESEVNTPALLIGAVHLVAFALAALACHGELANDRPEAGRLTEFYLWMSIGGVVGGLVAALLAPVVLDRLAEYPCVILVALALRPAKDQSLRPRLGDAAFAVGIGAVAFVVIKIATHFHAEGRILALALGLPVLAMYHTLVRPIRFTLALGATFVASIAYQPFGDALLHTRSFFGTLRVLRDPSHTYVQLVHGTTVHGRQNLATPFEAVSYYHASGPLGDVLTSHANAKNFGVVGLGAGSVAAYATAGQSWTFFEIDKDVIRIATDKRYFSYLSDAFPDPMQLHVIHGDGRLEIKNSAERWDVLIIDAFTSDAIPVHLLTTEAMDLYAAHLSESGVLAIHCSNRHLDLEPMLAALGAHAGLVSRIRHDPEERTLIGKNASTWVALAWTEGNLGPTLTSLPWRTLRATGMTAWTDDRSSIAVVLAQ